MKPQFKKPLSIALSTLLLLPISALGSDHIDFPGSQSNTDVPRSLDLTDLFTWTPSKGKLVIAVNTHLAAQPKNKFAENAEYIFRIRRAQIVKIPGASVSVPAIRPQEVTITCTFKNNKPSCKAAGSDKLNSQLQKLANPKGDKMAIGTKVFAGFRADPFILDVPWFSIRTAATAKPPVPGNEPNKLTQPYLNALIKAGALTEPTISALGLRDYKPTNFAKDLNVLNLTIELNTADLFGMSADKVGPLAIAAEVDKITSSGERLRVDRVGRPEITNMVVRDVDSPIKYKYNEEETFNIDPKIGKELMGYLAMGVLGWDGQDGKSNWGTIKMVGGKPIPTLNLNGKILIGKILINDAQIVNPAVVCGVNERTFLDLEKGKMNSCGGRTPGADIIDTLASFYTSGAKAKKTKYGDGVDVSDRLPTAQFPYFAKPY